MSSLSFDTECFGLFPFHGDHPFMVSLCTDDLKTSVYEAAKIDDSQRKATWSKAAIKEINHRIATADKLICHNLKFDVLMADNIGIGMLDYILAKPNDAEHFYEDTFPLSHVIYNDEPHGLKELAWKYLDFPAFDEFLLHEAINEVHALRRAWDNAIAKEKEPKENALHIKYQPHPLSRSESSNSYDFHLARHHPTLGNSCNDYAGKDALRTMLLWLNYRDALRTDLSERSKAIERVYLREKRLIFALLRQSGNPIHLRRTTLKSLISNAEKSLEVLNNDILEICQKYEPDMDNPNSDDQMRNILFHHLKLPIQGITKKSEKASVNKESLKGLLRYLSQIPERDLRKNHNRLGDALQIVQKSIEYAKVTTINNYNNNYINYAVDWDSKEPFLVFSYNPQGTRFTRGSSSQPNLQNVGSKDKDKTVAEFMEEMGESELYSTSLRSSFGPPKGKVWFSIDYSQIELQVFAWACGSKRLADLLNNSDVHDTVERSLFKTSGENRTLAKIASFSLIYGKQEDNFDAMTFPGAYKKYTTELFPESGPFITKTSKFVEQHGYVETASGYRLHLDKRRPYVGVNAICQGTAGDIIKLAMVGIDYYLRQRLESADFDPILQVHDELVFLSDKPNPAVHRIIYTVRRIMELSAIHYGIPCKTDLEIIRVSWDAPEKYSFKLSAKDSKSCEDIAKRTMKLIT